MKDQDRQQLKRAAMAYLNQWQITDRLHLSAVAAAGESDVALGSSLLAVAKEYRVGRAFSEKALAGSKAAAVEAFAKTAREFSAAPGALSDSVWAFAEGIGKSFPKEAGETPTQLSTATKILWFVGNHNVRIFDDFAYKALFGKKHYGKLVKSDWISFGSAWNDQYDAARLDVESAVNHLREDIGAILDWSLASENRAAAIAAMGEPWFGHRVFDKFLWLKGSAWRPRPRTKRKAG